jgi:hypothetical protein
MNAGMTIAVKYSCRPCGLHRVDVNVPVRGEHEDVKHWVEETMGAAISADHAWRSPHCASREMAEVMIPIAGADRVGDPAKQ